MEAHRRPPSTECLRPRTHHGPVIVQRGPDFLPNEIIGLIIEQLNDIQDIVKLRSVSPQFRNYIDDSIIIQRRLFRLPEFQDLPQAGRNAGWPRCLPTLPSGDAIKADPDDDVGAKYPSLHLDVIPDNTESNDQATFIPRFEHTPDYWKDMYVTQPPIIELRIHNLSECGEHVKFRAFSLYCQSGIKIWHIMHVLEREKELHHMTGDKKCHSSLDFMTSLGNGKFVIRYIWWGLRIWLR